MTQEQHYELWKSHHTNASTALEAFIEDRSKTELWQEYKSEMKLANKHWGIAKAMFTRKYGRI